MTAASLQGLCDRFWDWRLDSGPEFATFCGFHQFDDRLDDVSPEAYNKRKSEAASFLEEAQKISSSNLSVDDQLTLTVLKDGLTTYLDNQPFRAYYNACYYIGGPHVEFEDLISWMKFETVEDFQKYVARLKALPRKLSQTQELMKIAISDNRTYHICTMNGVVEAIEKMNVPAEDTYFMKPFLEADKEKLNIEDTQKQAVSVLNNEVIPALQKLGKFIKENYNQHLRQSVGVSSWSDGKKFYQACLDYHLSVHMTPQEVHDLGLREVSRIREEMEQVMKKLNFTGGLRAFTDHLRDDPKFYFSSKEEVLDGVKDVCYNKIRPKLSQLFHKIPSSELCIVASPPSKPNAPAGFYLAGTLDGSRPGKYYINCCDVKLNPKYELMTLSLHEGEPGHHFQGMYAIEMKEVPAFRKYMEDLNYAAMPSRFPFYTAYVEGWGLYCEYLGREMGLYDDPYDMFGHLSFEMHRACRLVVDTGMHALGWTREQAVELVRSNTALPEGFIQSEITRYMTWPGQACAYKIGQLKIVELRKKAEKELGDKFDVRDFHDEVLSCGYVPLNVLEEVVNSYIKRAGK